MAAEVTLELIDRVRLLLRYRVPLVDRDDHRASRIDRVTRDVRVEIRHSLDGVDHEDRDIGPLEGLFRHHHGKDLSHLGRLPFPADPGGIDQCEFLAVDRQMRVDRITRGAGDRRDDDPFLADRRPHA